MTPTSDQLLSALRSLLVFASGIAVAKGWIDSTTAATIAGALATIAVATWGWYSHSKDAMIKSVNSADNGVKVVSENAIAPQVDKALK